VRSKQPHLISRTDGEPFAMAGLYARWHPPGTQGGEALLSCAVITTEARGALRALHDRMPVILPREAEARWLDHSLDGNTEALLALLQPLPVEELELRPVSRRVNDVANDDAELLRRDESEPSLGLF
jgi:putative SOS response-associated peptidase YedK